MFDDGQTIFDERDDNQGGNGVGGRFSASSPAQIRFITRGDDPLDNGAGIVLRAGCPACGAEFTFCAGALDQWLAVFGKAKQLTLGKTGLGGSVDCPRCQHTLTYRVSPDEMKAYADIPMTGLILWLPHAAERLRTFRATQRQAFDRLRDRLMPWRSQRRLGMYPGWGFEYGEVEAPFPAWLFRGVCRSITENARAIQHPLTALDSHLIQHAERLDEMNHTLRSIEGRLGRIADVMESYRTPKEPEEPPPPKRPRQGKRK